MSVRGILFMLLSALFFCLAHTTQARAQSRQAVELSRSLYNQALRESDVEKKIKGYEAALELNPGFVEALYNLGLAYKKQQRLDQATSALEKAWKLREGTNNVTRMRIAYELGAVYRTTGQLADGEVVLTEARSWRGEPQTEIKIAFMLGNILFKLGKHAEALKCLNDARAGYPEAGAQLSSLIKVIEKDAQIRELFAEGEQAMSKGQLAEAREVFQRLKGISPADAKVDEKLVAIDSLLKLQQTDSSVETALQEAAQFEKEGDDESAIAIYRDVLAMHASEAIKQRMAAAQDRLAEKQKRASLERAYTEGLNAVRENKWSTAITAFREVMKTDPGYRDTAARLQEARNRFDQEVAARYYAEGLAALKKEDYLPALIAFENARSVIADFRDVGERIAELERRLSSQDAPLDSVAAARRVVTNVDSLYQLALNSMDRADWLKAIIALEKIKLMNPKFDDVDELLTLAHKKLSVTELAESAPATGRPGRSAAIIGGLVLSLLLLPTVGVLVFSTTVRARILLLRGRYQAAALAYERLLERNPANLKLYPILASLYLLSGRNDAKAIKIFKTILRLNLAFPQKDQLAQLVAQKYLTGEQIPNGENIPDETDIGAMEQALAREMRRKQQQ